MRATRRLGLSVLWAVSSLAGWTQDYEVKLERPAKAGEKYGLTATGSQKEVSTVSVGGQVAEKKDNAFTASLEAQVTILTVDGKGRATATEYAVAKFTMKKGEQETELVPAGKVVVAERGKKPAYALKDGGAVSPEAQAAFGLLVSSGDKGEESDDAIFGTAARQAVGAEWPMDAAKAAASLQKAGIALTKENLSGSVKLNGVEQAGGLDCLNVVATMNAKGFAMPLPPGLKCEAAELNASFGGLFPVDPAQPRLAESKTMQMRFSAKGKAEGQDLALEAAIGMNAEQKRTYPEK